MTPDALQPLPTSRSEIADLFERFDIAIGDVCVDQQSAEGRYLDAYTAGLLLAKIVIRAAGCRVKSGDNHRDTLLAVPWLMGGDPQPSVDALDAARKRRNATMYDAAHIVPDSNPLGEPADSNGLALCSLHHSAFNRQFVGLTPDYVIQIRPDILEEEDGPTLSHAIQALHGRKIALPRSTSLRPDPSLLERRQDQIPHAS
jgi:hypothetical protein